VMLGYRAHPCAYWPSLALVTWEYHPWSSRPLSCFVAALHDPSRPSAESTAELAISLTNYSVTYSPPWLLSRSLRGVLSPSTFLSLRISWLYLMPLLAVLDEHSCRALTLKL